MGGCILFSTNFTKQKKAKETSRNVRLVKEGAEVVTNGGIKGTISSIGPEFLTIRVDKGVNIQVLKNSISRVLK